MSKFEAARIKILDENTRQVIKEIDALTSDEAVYCDDGSITLKDKLLALNKSINNSADTIVTIVKNYDESFVEVNKAITNQENQIQEILKKNNQYDTNFIQISQKFDEVKNEINSNTKKIEDLFDVTVDLSNKITDINKALNKHQEYIDALKEENVTQNNQINQLNQNLTDITKRVQELENHRRTDVMLFSQAGDPGNAAKNGDIWYNSNINAFQSKLSNGQWKPIGAAYN